MTARSGSDPASLTLPTLAGIEDAARLIRDRVPETPLVRSEILSRALDAEIWLKNETVSPIASYKIRGALSAILRNAARRPLTGVATSSSGNHGQGVAYAARMLDLPADIFLPDGANPVKAAMLRALGATVHHGEPDIDAAKERGRAFARERGAYFVDDGEDLDMMEGAGTVGLEIARALPRLDAAFVPMGSGVVASGCATAIKAIHPGARIFAVNGEGSTAMTESFRAGRVVEKPITATLDGMNCRIPARLALTALLAKLDEAVVVSEAALLAGVHTMAESAHILVEPAGAAGLAAAWQLRDRLRGQTVALVLTGANITMPHLNAALATPPFFSIHAVAPAG